eukprot:snap_masked-scaffold_5-processed-gene-4.15-mRNA-1 protein AED:1.00 eAED:1.00 QI:0/0/0/0/1/1/2/0/492
MKKEEFEERIRGYCEKDEIKLLVGKSIRKNLIDKLMGINREKQPDVWLDARNSFFLAIVKKFLEQLKLFHSLEILKLEAKPYDFPSDLEVGLTAFYPRLSTLLRNNHSEKDIQVLAFLFGQIESLLSQRNALNGSSQHTKLRQNSSKRHRACSKNMVELKWKEKYLELKEVIDVIGLETPQCRGFPNSCEVSPPIISFEKASQTDYKHGSSVCDKNVSTQISFNSTSNDEIKLLKESAALILDLIDSLLALNSSTENHIHKSIPQEKSTPLEDIDVKYEIFKRNLLSNLQNKENVKASKPGSPSFLSILKTAYKNKDYHPQTYSKKLFHNNKAHSKSIFLENLNSRGDNYIEANLEGNHLSEDRNQDALDVSHGNDNNPTVLTEQVPVETISSKILTQKSMQERDKETAMLDTQGEGPPVNKTPKQELKPEPQSESAVVGAHEVVEEVIVKEHAIEKDNLLSVEHEESTTREQTVEEVIESSSGSLFTSEDS